MINRTIDQFWIAPLENFASLLVYHVHMKFLTLKITIFYVVSTLNRFIFPNPPSLDILDRLGGAWRG